MLVLISDVNAVNLDDYNIHVIASVLKQWLRDLPNPLMTFELYEEFLRVTGMATRFGVVIRGGPVFSFDHFTAAYCHVACRLAGQERSVERCVYSHRSAQQDSPEHARETHLPPSQVRRGKVFKKRFTAHCFSIDFNVQKDRKRSLTLSRVSGLIYQQGHVSSVLLVSEYADWAEK